MLDPVQQEARALGDPTRYEIFAFILHAGRRVEVAELTDHLGLHHSAIRQHLAKLVDAGLLVEQVSEPRGRGRPPLTYEVDPGVGSRWGAIGPYEKLALWLSESVRTGDPPREVGRSVGRRAAQESSTTGEDDDSPIAALVDLMARHGFEPSLHQQGEVFEVAIHACPFASVATVDPATVCDLHLGMAEGIAEATGGLTIDDLSARDPRRVPCRLRCRLR